MRSSGLAGVRWHVDALVPVCGLAALGVYLLHGFGGVLSRDVGVYAYAGQRVADGLLPYEGILNRAGPLAHAVPGLGARAARLVGADELLGMRVLLMLLAVASVTAIYQVGRDVFASRPAGLASAAALLCSEGFLRAATYGPREKTAMVLALELTLLAVARQHWGTAGVMVATGSLVWQPVALPAITAVCVALLLGGRGRLVALARVVAGGLVPTVLTIAVYAALGRLRLLVDDFFLINLRYTDQASVLDRPLAIWADLQRGYGWTVWLGCGGLVVLLHAAVAAAGARRGEAGNAALVGVGATVVVSALWALAAFNGWPDAFVVLPAAALGTGSVVTVLGRWLPVRALAVAVTGWALVATGVAAVYAEAGRTDGVTVQRAEAEALVRTLPTGSRVLAVESPGPLVLLGRRNPTRLQLFGNGLLRYVDDTWPGGSAGYARWIEGQRIEVVVVGQIERAAWLRPVLARSYVLAGGPHTVFHWYVRRDLAVSTGLDELRDALGKGRRAARADVR